MPSADHASQASPIPGRMPPWLAHKDLLWIPVFWALYLAFRWFFAQKLELTDFSGRQIGIATLHAHDIQAKVRLIYQLIIGAVAVYLGINAALHYLRSRIPASRTDMKAELKFSSSLAFVALCVLVLRFFNESMHASLNVMLGLWIAHAVLMSLRLVKHPWTGLVKPLSLYSVLIITAVGVFVCYRELALHLTVLPTLPLTWFVPIFVLMGGGLAMLIPAIHEQRIQSGIRFLWPLAALPLISVLAREIFLIANQRGFHGLHPAYYHLILLLALLLGIFWVYRKAAGIAKPSPEQYLNRRWYPLAILSFSTLGLYQPFLSPSQEMFELANPALGIARYFSYGHIPFLESFSSHALSELFFGFVYTLFNGYHGLDYALYDFLNLVLMALLAYYFLGRLSGSYPFAFALVILYPNLVQIIHPFFYPTILTVWVMEKLLKAENLKNYLLFFLLMGFLILWRIDMGYANAIVMLVLFGLLKAPNYRLINWKAALQAMAILLAGTAILLLPFVLIRDIPLFENLRMVYHYLSSSQSYGLLAVSYSRSMPFYFQYFIFPILILAFGLYLVSGLRASLKDPLQQFRALGLLVLIIFYLANFQRGVVRHSFAEGVDSFLSSFAFLILPAAVFYLVRGRQQLAVFSLVLILFMFAFRLHMPQQNKSFYSMLKQQSENLPQLDHTRQFQSRINTWQGYAGDKYQRLKNFLDTHFDGSATFMDFSNTPMLYFYLQREPAAYFNQTLLCVHDDYLQQAKLRYMASMDIPIVIYGHEAPDWFDAVDGVPNRIRHYRLSGFIYEQYSPWAVIDGFRIWLRNDLYPHFEQYKESDGISPYPDMHPMEDPLLHLPRLWGAYDMVYQRKREQAYASFRLQAHSGDDGLVYLLPETLPSLRDNYLEVRIAGQGHAGELRLAYGNAQGVQGSSTCLLQGVPGEETLLIPLSNQYYWHTAGIRYLKLSLSNPQHALPQEVRLLIENTGKP